MDIKELLHRIHALIEEYLEIGNTSTYHDLKLENDNLTNELNSRLNELRELKQTMRNKAHVFKTLKEEHEELLEKNYTLIDACNELNNTLMEIE
jgi:hypothetical protein